MLNILVVSNLLLAKLNSKIQSIFTMMSFKTCIVCCLYISAEKRQILHDKSEQVLPRHFLYHCATTMNLLCHPTRSWSRSCVSKISDESNEKILFFATVSCSLLNQSRCLLIYSDRLALFYRRAHKIYPNSRNRCFSIDKTRCLIEGETLSCKNIWQPPNIEKPC